MPIKEELVSVFVILALLVLFVMLWGVWYRILCSIWARFVLTGDDHRQFKVVTTCRKTGATKTLEMSVSHPPHKKKAVIRAISSWLRLHGMALISITVNRPNGATIYKWYE